MIKKPVAIILGLTLLLGGLFKCDAFSAEKMPKPEPSFLSVEYTILIAISSLAHPAAISNVTIVSYDAAAAVEVLANP